jgi:hypothetical protein
MCSSSRIQHEMPDACAPRKKEDALVALDLADDPAQPRRMSDHGWSKTLLAGTH